MKVVLIQKGVLDNQNPGLAWVVLFDGQYRAFQISVPGEQLTVYRAVVRAPAPGVWGFRKEDRKKNRQSITISTPRIESLCNNSSEL